MCTVRCFCAKLCAKPIFCWWTEWPVVSSKTHIGRLLTNPAPLATKRPSQKTQTCPPPLSDHNLFESLRVSPPNPNCGAFVRVSKAVFVWSPCQTTATVQFSPELRTKQPVACIKGLATIALVPKTERSTELGTVQLCEQSACVQTTRISRTTRPGSMQDFTPTSLSTRKKNRIFP